MAKKCEFFFISLSASKALVCLASLGVGRYLKALEAEADARLMAEGVVKIWETKGWAESHVLGVACKWDRKRMAQVERAVLRLLRERGWEQSWNAVFDAGL